MSVADSIEGLREHITLYASFDEGLDAKVSRGDGTATVEPLVVKHDPDGGRFGGAAVFSAANYGWDENEFTFSAEGNFPYSESAFEGSISMWLCGDPDADLDSEVPVDPFHISRRAADGSFYLDLTRPNDDRYGSPRHLRFGIYNDSEENSRFVNGQLVVIGELGWKHEAWHHVVAMWRNANSIDANGSAKVYIDGVLRGWVEGYEHRVTWDVSGMTIGLGQRYSGKIDELLILDEAIDSETVRALYSHDRPVAD